MDIASYTQRVFQPTSGGHPESQAPALRSAIERDAANTFQELAENVYNSPARQRLEKLYTANYASGVINLGIAPFTDLLFDSIPTARVMYPLGGGQYQKVEFYANPNDLDAPKLAGFYLGSVLGNSYLIQDNLGQPLADATVLLYASFIPDFTSLPFDLENDLCDVGIKRVVRFRLGAAAVGQ